jgi:hypothetical protein
VIPDLCRSTVRKGNSISADFKENNITKTGRTTPGSALFRKYGSCFVFICFTLQEKYNIHALSDNVKSIYTRSKNGQKSSLFYPFLKLVQKIIYFQATYIYLIYMYRRYNVNIIHKWIKKSLKISSLSELQYICVHIVKHKCLFTVTYF